MKQLHSHKYPQKQLKIQYIPITIPKVMIEQPPQVPIEIDTKSQPQSQTSQMKAQHRNWLMLQCQFWIFNLFIMGLCLYLVSQFVRVDVQAQSVYNTTQYRYGQEAVDMWKKGYVVDIKEVNTDNCPQGYKELISYYWPGTYDGCYCQTMVANHATEYIMQGACSSELIALGCTTVPAMSKQNMKMWKGSKLLCYKRIQSLNFYNSTLPKTQQGTATKSCALNKTYQIQTLPNISCPATVISNTSVGTSTQTILTLDSLSLTPKKLYYENQQNYPIADFKLTQYKFCSYWNQSNISPDKNGNYILELTNFTGTCNGTDPRVVEFDYLTQEDFFTNNTRVYDMISALPGYPRPSISYYYRLGFIRYPAWTNDCRNSQTHSLLQATKHLKFTHITQKTKLIMYVGVPCLIIVAVLSRILYMIRHIFQLRAKKQYNMIILTDHQIGDQIPNLNIVKSFKKQLALFLLELSLILATLVVLCIGAAILISESAWIKESFNRKCTEDHLNWIFRYNQDKVDNCGFVVGRCVMFVVVVFGVEVGHFVVRRKLGDLKEKELPPAQSLSNQALIKDDLNQKSNIILHQNLQMQDSSDIILHKQKQQLKIYDLDNFMSNELQGGAGETGLNFYAQSIEQDNFQVAKKKKKKGVKRKNLFKEGEEK